MKLLVLDCFQMFVCFVEKFGIVVGLVDEVFIVVVLVCCFDFVFVSLSCYWVFVCIVDLVGVQVEWKFKRLICLDVFVEMFLCFENFDGEICVCQVMCGLEIGDVGFDDEDLC